MNSVKSFKILGTSLRYSRETNSNIVCIFNEDDSVYARDFSTGVVLTFLGNNVAKLSCEQICDILDDNNAPYYNHLRPKWYADEKHIAVDIWGKHMYQIAGKDESVDILIGMFVINKVEYSYCGGV